MDYGHPQTPMSAAIVEPMSCKQPVQVPHINSIKDHHSTMFMSQVISSALLVTLDLSESHAQK
jgi:hypothetical protein